MMPALAITNVIPANAGISCRIAPSPEIPAFAGMTE